MLINLQHISYQLPHQEPIFQQIKLTLAAGEKAAIVGRNGAGKTTLLQIIAGRQTATTGDIQLRGSLYYVPQHYGHYRDQSIAEALGIAHWLTALEAVENGDLNPHWYEVLDQHWDIRALSEAALAQWGLQELDLNDPLWSLSGGMKTRLFLCGITLYNPDIVLLDEPTNHLDKAGREQLYQWLQHTGTAVLLCSHDRQLLQLCNPIYELDAKGMHAYGGNYELYAAQKAANTNAKEQELAHHEKALKEAKQQQQQALERKQRSDARASKLATQGGIPKILINGRRNSAEGSTAKLQATHTGKIGLLRQQLQNAAAMVEIERLMKGHFEAPMLPNGKVLAAADAINHAYTSDNWLWPQPLTFTLRSGERLSISGANGSGKSTLLHLLLGNLSPAAGSLQSTPVRALLLDQDYQLIDRHKTVLEQAMHFNERKLEPAWVHTLLANFLFFPAQWHQSCASLSGGEMLRLSLCCMVLQAKAPDVIFLDEPTNNLDLTNITMLEKIFANYRGTLVVISHDQAFLDAVGIDTEWNL
ncbi:ATP-binding cassette domain-containing protein [Paraflavitalea sp. CAU 1676]|uniref:ATP-binding cassette domain-containing protein n=1 Tax=Paraflavitalea sp. CAU 1676 TaxID=3032598 RepID=UPI0023D9FCF1|nr:ATP-binding cassette domain-containing protein [Paraflavitalea sp. CAU 1676]